jgi:hypothetical protein
LRNSECSNVQPQSAGTPSCHKVDLNKWSPRANDPNSCWLHYRRVNEHMATTCISLHHNEARAMSNLISMVKIETFFFWKCCIVYSSVTGTTIVNSIQTKCSHSQHVTILWQHLSLGIKDQEQLQMVHNNHQLCHSSFFYHR